MENEPSNFDACSPTTQISALTHLLFSRSSSSRLWCCLHTLRFLNCCWLSLLQECQQWTTCEQAIIHMMQFSIGIPITTPSTQHSIIGWVYVGIPKWCIEDSLPYPLYKSETELRTVSDCDCQNIIMTTATVHVVASQVYHIMGAWRPMIYPTQAASHINVALSWVRQLNCYDVLKSSF